ncbi:hypothetical protein KC316_g6460 [Hortaea werneckii]|nr:hypothetical protein KC324_g5411 [Hortaea werneckii]KAI7584860.1 hypothetical protein KC316_g6460 [Hortaea werneckii]RMY16306.1 hypothetical protein D0868_00401 [Hortaea werneckii]
MARSPSDATRFTATGPYASSSPSFGSNNPGQFSQIDFGSAPAGETPQQKIARLRAAAAAAKRGKESNFDSVVRVGRVWADRAHRFTAVGLIGLTVVSGAVATAGITDMLLHNRRRRNEWLAEQQVKSAKELAEAKMALSSGSATEDQILLINRERAADAAAEARKNQPGVFKRTTNWLFSGLSQEEQKGGRLGATAAVNGPGSSMQHVKEEVHGQQHDRSTLELAEQQLNSKRRQGERVEEVVNPSGGPLDRQAQQTLDAVSDTSKGWFSWLRR